MHATCYSDHILNATILFTITSLEFRRHTHYNRNNLKKVGTTEILILIYILAIKTYIGSPTLSVITSDICLLAAHRNIWGIKSDFKYTWCKVAVKSGYFCTKSEIHGILMMGCPKVKHMVLAFNSSEPMKLLSFHNTNEAIQAINPPDEKPINKLFRLILHSTVLYGLRIQFFSAFCQLCFEHDIITRQQKTVIINTNMYVHIHMSLCTNGIIQILYTRIPVKITRFFSNKQLFY